MNDAYREVIIRIKTEAEKPAWIHVETVWHGMLNAWWEEA